MVTAAAALDSGTITPDTPIDAPGSLDVQGQPLENDFGTSYSGLTLDDALTNSVNTWFAQVGERVGEDTLFEYMDKFGFNTKPAIDLPSEELTTSGIVDLESGDVLTRSDPIDIARVAIGQERLLATPLQIAEVAAAVANGGKLMKPQIWSRVIDPDGRVIDELDPSEFSQPISEETAAELTTAMEGVVSGGTGTNAAIPGVPVAGKTGTAETPGNASLRRRRRREPGLVHGLRARPTNRRSRSRRRSSAPNSSATTSRRRSSARSPNRSSKKENDRVRKGGGSA